MTSPIYLEFLSDSHFLNRLDFLQLGFSFLQYQCLYYIFLCAHSNPQLRRYQSLYWRSLSLSTFYHDFKNEILLLGANVPSLYKAWLMTESSKGFRNCVFVNVSPLISKAGKGVLSLTNTQKSGESYLITIGLICTLSSNVGKCK